MNQKYAKNLTSQLWVMISSWLDKLPHTTEDKELLQKLCMHYSRKRNIVRGKIPQIAASLLWLYARVNFLGEGEGKMWQQKELAKLCGVSVFTMGSKASAIMKTMKIILLDIRYSRKEQTSKNPMNRMRIDPATGFVFLSEDDDGFSIPLVRNDHDYYYDAMEFLNVDDAEGAIRLLHKALEINSHSVEAYVGLVAAYQHKGNNKKFRENAELAFYETKCVFPKWPERMSWGEIEKRQYLRAIEYMAFAHWINKERTFAEKLFKLLLRLNPNDNQGVRFSLACFYAGLPPEAVDDLVEEGNMKQDWSTIDGLLEKQNMIHHFWTPPRD